MPVPSTWEAEAGGLQVQDQPGLHSKTLSQTNKRTELTPTLTAPRVFVRIKHWYELLLV
jgi:hypothetical protein